MNLAMQKGSRDPAHLRGRKILIVEDEALIARELVMLLRQHDCVVIGPAKTVAQAIGLVEKEQPELALIDLNLNGEFAAPLAEVLSARSVPFVIMTGYGRLPPGEPALQKAPRLDKPVDHRLLLAILSELAC
jgi:DNA-binding NtrC family response regulator